MDGHHKMDIVPILTAAASPAWSPKVSGGSAWWLPAWTHQRAAAADRRRSRRRVPTGNAVALLRSSSEGLPCIERMNMGAIGMAVLKANPSRMGKIADISITGLAFRYVDAVASAVQPCRLDILLAEKGFYLQDIAFSVVADMRRIDDAGFYSTAGGRLSVRFQNLSDQQRLRLRHFITSFTRERS